MDHTHCSVGNAYRSSSQTQKKAEPAWKELLGEHWEVIALRKNLQAKEEEKQECPPSSQKTGNAEQNPTDLQKSKLECLTMKVQPQPQRRRGAEKMLIASVPSDFEQLHQEVHFYQHQQYQVDQLKLFVDAKHERYGNIVKQIFRTSNDVDS